MIISFINQKGGVGKTTLSICTAYELSKNNKVLLIDADPQNSVIVWSDTRDKSLPPGLSIASLAKKTLHRDIGSLSEGFDHVVIDTPPRLSEITRSATIASDLVVIPCTPSPYDVWASKDTLDVVKEGTIYHENLKYVFTLNRKIINTVIGREVREAIKEIDEDLIVLQTEIIQRMVFAESAINGLAVQEIDKEGKASKEISSFVDELFTLEGKE